MAETERGGEPQAPAYEPPEVEDISTEVGPVVTAAGESDFAPPG